MKRYLILCISLLLVVSLMAVPALAASDGGFLFEDGECLTNDFVPDSNKQYTGRVYAAFPDLGLDYAWYEFAPIELFIDDSAQDLYFNCNFSFVVGGQQYETDFAFSLNHDLWVIDDLSSAAGDIRVTAFELTPYEPEPADPPVTDQSAAESVFAVFAGIGTWFIAELSNVTSLFYQADSGLTLLGVLSVSVIGIAVVFYLIKVIKNFLCFRG